MPILFLSLFTALTTSFILILECINNRKFLKDKLEPLFIYFKNKYGYIFNRDIIHIKGDGVLHYEVLLMNDGTLKNPYSNRPLLIQHSVYGGDYISAVKLQKSLDSRVKYKIDYDNHNNIVEGYNNYDGVKSYLNYQHNRKEFLFPARVARCSLEARNDYYYRITWRRKEYDVAVR